MARPVPLNTATWGSPGDRRILLLHGITSSAAGWWRVGPDLASRGWHVVTADLRGHGESPDPGSYRFADQAADIRALGTGWEAVLGHSMGGSIAVLAATADPSWTKGLVLQDPALMLPEPMSEVLEWLLQEYEKGGDPGHIAELSPRWHERDVVAKAAALRATSPEVIRQTVEQNWPWLVLDEARRLEVATIVLGSDPGTGGILPITFGDWLAQSPFIEFEVIPNSSHSTHRDDDQYDTYLSTLVAALDRLPTLGG